MSSSQWGDDDLRNELGGAVADDDELLTELRGALAEEAVDASVIEAAQAVFTWRTVDAELEVLGLAAESAAPAAVRGGSGPEVTRTFRFHGERLSVDVEIDEEGIVGQLSPPGAGQVTLVTADGPRDVTLTDEVGGFMLPPPPPGPMRLDCRLGPDHFVTEWISI
jgi:hypothetical protein